VSKLED